MNIFKDFLTRINKHEGLFIFKQELINQIRNTSKQEFSIKHDQNSNLIIVAIPVDKKFKV